VNGLIHRLIADASVFLGARHRTLVCSFARGARIDDVNNVRFCELHGISLNESAALARSVGIRFAAIYSGTTDIAGLALILVIILSVTVEKCLLLPRCLPRARGCFLDLR
jgi:hypothetical protein